MSSAVEKLYKDKCKEVEGLKRQNSELRICFQREQKHVEMQLSINKILLEKLKGHGEDGDELHIEVKGILLKQLRDKNKTQPLALGQKIPIKVPPKVGAPKRPRLDDDDVERFLHNNTNVSKWEGH